MANANTKGWLQTVLDALQGGDEAKLKRLQKKSCKLLEDSLTANNREIEEAQERITDLQESLQDTVASPDVNQIQTTESTKAYANLYVSSIRDVLAEIQEVKDFIEELEDENAVYSEILDLLK